MTAQRRPRRRGPLRDDGQHEKRNGDAERVEECDEERSRPGVMVRGCDRDRGEHRSGARDEDETEAQAEDEAASLVGIARCSEPREGTLDHLSDLGDEEAHRQEAEQGDAQPEQEVLGEMEEAEQRAGEEDGEAEAHYQPGDDHVGPPLAGCRRATRHDDGDDGHDARRQPGDQPTEECDDEELTHASRSAGDRKRALMPLSLGNVPWPKLAAGPRGRVSPPTE